MEIAGLPRIISVLVLPWMREIKGVNKHLIKEGVEMKLDRLKVALIVMCGYLKLIEIILPEQCARVNIPC